MYDDLDVWMLVQRLQYHTTPQTVQPFPRIPWIDWLRWVCSFKSWFNQCFFCRRRTCGMVRGLSRCRGNGSWPELDALIIVLVVLSLVMAVRRGRHAYGAWCNVAKVQMYSAKDPEASCGSQKRNGRTTDVLQQSDNWLVWVRLKWLEMIEKIPKIIYFLLCLGAACNNHDISGSVHQFDLSSIRRPSHHRLSIPVKLYQQPCFFVYKMIYLSNANACLIIAQPLWLQDWGTGRNLMFTTLHPDNNDRQPWEKIIVPWKSHGFFSTPRKEKHDLTVARGNLQTPLI